MTRRGGAAAPRPRRLAALIVALGLAALLLAGLAACGSPSGGGPLVVVFSDLGTSDYALSALKGDIYATYPAARVADGSVSMPALDVAAAAYILDLGSATYPEGTIFVSTTNPGDAKGASCLAAVTAGGHIYLASDNGTLTRLAKRPGFSHVYRISEQALFAKPLDSSSPDYILAVAAGLLASGKQPADLGPEAEGITTLDLPDARLVGSTVTGTVVFVDGFGNCLTNIPAVLAVEAGIGRGGAATVSWEGGHATVEVVRSYGDVPVGDPLLLFEAPSPLQLSVNMGSFAETYGVGAGALVTVAPGGTGGGEPAELSAACSDIQAALDGLDGDLAAAAKELAATGLDTAAAREVLRGLAAAHPEVVDFSTVSATGVMLAVEPQEYSSAEGSDISAQEQVVRLHKTLRPVLSKTFLAVEGFAAVDLEWPVLAADGSLAGSVSALLRTDTFIGDIVAEVPTEPGVDKLWAMDTDGLILYDPDAEQVGTNLFLDPLYQPYTDLIALGREIARRPTGSGSYEFLAQGSTTPIVKDATWDSVGLHGTRWRIVAALVAEDQGT